MEIREHSLKYARIRKEKMKNKEAEVEADIHHLEKPIQENNLSNQEKDKLTKEPNTNIIIKQKELL